MATKKKASKKTTKKAAKKTAATGDKPARKRSARKALPPYEPNPERIERFMHTLIKAGFAGDKPGEDGKERKRQSSGTRQMAESLDRQFRKYGS